MLLDIHHVNPTIPSGCEDIGGRVVMTRYGDGPELEVPVLDDPKVLAAHLDFIKRLGARYDGHPDIDHVDLGSVGWWGEWHMSQSSNAPMPTLETQKKIVDAYLAAFQKTPLVMLIGGGDMLEVRNGERNRLAGRLPRRHGRLLQDVVSHANGLSAGAPGGGRHGRLEDCTGGLGDLLGHAEVGE